MTDIDFDELDKAVNSLMGGVASKTKGDQEKPKTLAIGTTLKPGENPVYDRLGEVAKTIGNETLTSVDEQTVVEELGSRLPTSELAVAELDTVATGNDTNAVHPPTTTPLPAPKPAVKRPNSGRFMDVVHRSSDMRPSSSGPSIVMSDRPSAQTEHKPEPLPADKPDEKPVITKPELVEQPQVSPEPPIDSAPTTPFLPDAKVEKRALGDPTASAGGVPSPFIDTNGSQKDTEVTETTPVNSESESPPDTHDSDEQRLLDPKQYESKESADVMALQSVESTEVIEEATEQSVFAVESGDTEKLSSNSIQRQDTEKVAETPEAAGAIYDVKNYHQPLGHPAKQKSGWGVVILIVLIIVVCAAIGTAAYFILGSGL